MKYVLHGYNVVSPRLGKNGRMKGLFDSAFDLSHCGELSVKSVEMYDGFIERWEGSDKRLIVLLITGVGAVCNSIDMLLRIAVQYWQ